MYIISSPFGKCLRIQIGIDTNTSGWIIAETTDGLRFILIEMDFDFVLSLFVLGSATLLQIIDLV